MDNFDGVGEITDADIDRLFPKCHPRPRFVRIESPTEPSADSTATFDIQKSHSKLSLHPESTQKQGIFDVNANNKNSIGHPVYGNKVVILQNQEIESGSRSSSSVSRMSVESACARTSSSVSRPSSQTFSESLSEIQKPPTNDINAVNAFIDEQFSAAIDESNFDDHRFGHNAHLVPQSIISGKNKRSNSNESYPAHNRRDYLHDSRIESAGGKEIFSHSRRSARKKTYFPHLASNHPPLEHHKSSPFQMQHQKVVKPRFDFTYSERVDSSTCSNSSRSNSSNSASSPLSSKCSNDSNELKSHDRILSNKIEKESQLIDISEFTNVVSKMNEGQILEPGSVVFDDIGQWIEKGLSLREIEEKTGFNRNIERRANNSASLSSPISQSDGDYDYDGDAESPARVTRIGTVPIAEYKGSPRRYGQSPQCPPRPGFPKRVNQYNHSLKSWKNKVPSPYDKENSKDLAPTIERSVQSLVGQHSEEVPEIDRLVNATHPEEVNSPLKISTLTSSYASNVSKDAEINLERTKSHSAVACGVYNDFGFEDSETRKVLEEFFMDSKQKSGEFFDLEYTLKRQKGNSYVGQRLASSEDDGRNEETNIKPKIKSKTRRTKNYKLKEVVVKPESTLLTKPSDFQLENLHSSRNFTLSPDSTSCESAADVESDLSTDAEADDSIPSSMKQMNTMPVLEDGLSSGEEKDVDEKEITTLYKEEAPTSPNQTYQDNILDSLYNSNGLSNSLKQIEKISHQRRSPDGQLCRGELPSFQNRLDFCDQAGNLHYSAIPTRVKAATINDSHSSSSRNHITSLHSNGNHSTPYSLPNSNDSPVEISAKIKQVHQIEKEFSFISSKQNDEKSQFSSIDLIQLEPISEKYEEPPPPPAPHPHRDAALHRPQNSDLKQIDSLNVSSHFQSKILSQDVGSSSDNADVNSVGFDDSLMRTDANHDEYNHFSAGVDVVTPTRESVEAALADIKDAIKNTKNLNSKTSTQELQDKTPVWIPRSNHSGCDANSSLSLPALPHEESQRGSDDFDESRHSFLRQTSPGSDHHRRNQSNFHDDDDGDTDLETDRLLGQQRSEAYLEEKTWTPHQKKSGLMTEKSEDSDDLESNATTSSSSPKKSSSNLQFEAPLESPELKTSSKPLLPKKEKEQSKKKSRSKEVMVHEPSVLIEGVLFRARYLGSTQLVSEGQPTKSTRMMQAEEAVSRIKAPEGEDQPSTEVDLFISTEKIMVLNTDLKEIMMDHSLRTISYIADIGDLVVLMARRRILPTDEHSDTPGHRIPKMICHVFESEEAQFIAQSIGQAFQVAYLEFLKANGIEDHSFVKEMDYQEVLNAQEIFGDELQMFAKKELQKEVVVPKLKGDILGVVVVESGWGSMVPTVVIANLSPCGAAARCGQMNIGDQIIAINGISLVGLPLSSCQNYIKNTKNNTAVKLTVVPCPPVVEVKIRRPDTKYQLGFSVQNGVICSLLRGGIAERGGVRVGHRIIEINNQSVVAVPHEKIVNLLATSVGEIRMKTMPTSIFRLLTGQETPQYI